MHTDERITIAEAARRLGKSSPAMRKQLQRHGVVPDSHGRYLAKAVFQAAATGAELDKAKVGEGLRPGTDPLHRRKLLAQIALIESQGEKARIEVAKIRGELVSLDEHRASNLRITEACRRTIDIWIKTTAAEAGDVVTKRKLEDARRKAFNAIRAALENR